MKKTTCNHLSATTYLHSVYRSGIKLYESDTARGTRLLKYHVSHCTHVYRRIVFFLSAQTAFTRTNVQDRINNKKKRINYPVNIVVFNLTNYCKKAYQKILETKDFKNS